MGTDRRIDTAGTVKLPVRHFADHLLIERFAHAVQALELILTGIVVVARQLINRRQGVGIMGSELRIDQAWHGQQFAGTGQIRDIGVNLAGVDRIAFQAFHLGALDFAVPVRAFHQTNHQATAAALRQIDQLINHKRTAFHVGLNNETDAVPAFQLWLETEFLQ